MVIFGVITKRALQYNCGMFLPQGDIIVQTLGCTKCTTILNNLIRFYLKVIKLIFFSLSKLPSLMIRLVSMVYPDLALGHVYVACLELALCINTLNTW